MNSHFPHLYSPITLGNCTIKNRIVSTGHHTYLADDQPGDDLIAYHEARAAGGAGLIVSEIIAVHETAAFSGSLLKFHNESATADYRRLVDVCHQYGCKVFAQLFHPGREILSTNNGLAPIAYAPSAVANERFHILPKVMDVNLIQSIVNGFGQCAKNLATAGFDGVEIVGSHGYLPAQFLSPAVNLRCDAYGGDFTRRLTFIKEVINAVRTQAPELVLGLRLSTNDHEPEGLDEEAITKVCAALDNDFDYFSLVAGSSATLGASVHITPPMGIESAYLASASGKLHQTLNTPIIVTGRINQPQVAEQIIADGEADLCGMTRAMICDANMPNKAMRGELDDIRACIACNQACIGRAHKGLGISCIQHPESGRELQFGKLIRPDHPKKVVVVGAGPAGMKAAAVAAAAGHSVTVYEKAAQAGGQALLAHRLPGREEFAGIVSNLMFEATSAGVEFNFNCEMNLALLEPLQADHVILATGATAHRPQFELLNKESTFTYDAVLNDPSLVGRSVVIADWQADWIGIGLAERLARDGCHVRLAVNAAMAGESLQVYTRNHYLARLYSLGVEISTHLRLYGSDENTVYLQNTLSDEAVVFDDVDTLVLSMGHLPNTALEDSLVNTGIDAVVIGDGLMPRTAEEAVYEGLIAGRGI